MAGLGEDEFLQFQLNPGKAEVAAGGPGQVGGKAFEQLAGSPTGLGLEDFTEGVVIDGFPQIVPGGGPGKGGYGKDRGAKDGLDFSALGVGHAEMAEELQIDNGERSGHGV